VADNSVGSESALTLIHETIPPAAGEPPYPGLLLLHGRGSNELDLLPLGPRLDSRLFVVSARGPYAFGSDAYYWYDLEASIAGRPSRESIDGSLRMVDRLMNEAVASYSIDPNRFYVGGFSMGGAMAAAALLSLPENVAGALILSGYVPVQAGLPWDTDAVAGKPVFQAHGILDDVLPIQFGRISRDFMAQTPVSLTYKEYPIGHMVSPVELDDAAAWMGGILDRGQG
jgi:phospholipase/carboxylesterase